MKDKEVRRIMNDELDGIAPPEDAARLKRELAGSPETRDEYRKLGGVFAALSRMGMEEPPSDLKQNVLRMIRHAESVSVRNGWLESLRAAFRKRPVFRYAYSFAAGTALGVAIFALVSRDVGSRMGPAVFSGAMIPAGDLTGFQNIDRVELGLKEGRVIAETLSREDGLVARVTARAPRGTGIEISFDPGGLRPVALRQASSYGNVALLGFDRLTLTVEQSGESQYLLYLARRGPAGSPLRIIIRTADGFLQSELHTGAPRQLGGLGISR